MSNILDIKDVGGNISLNMRSSFKRIIGTVLSILGVFILSLSVVFFAYLVIFSLGQDMGSSLFKVIPMMVLGILFLFSGRKLVIAAASKTE
jgi:lipopolysaccharide/colanic/teichoic acid biosynthesis glycosyltransferase